MDAVRGISRLAREHSPKNKGLRFYNPRKSRGDVKAYIISSSFDPILSNQDCHGAS